MIEYPSIPIPTGVSFREIPNAFIFDKLDGSGMRSEWSKKKGWFKHGRRHGLLDESNPQLLCVPDLFMEQLSENLARIAVEQQWKSLIVFYEFWGKNSLAGWHEEDDPKFLTVFDVIPDKEDFLPPKEFRKIFEDQVSTAKFLGQYNFTRGFVDQVYSGQIEGITFEGIVAKAKIKDQIVRAKAKTKPWLDRIKNRFGEDCEYLK